MSEQRSTQVQNQNFTLDQLPEMICRQQPPQVLGQYLEWLIQNHKPLNEILNQLKDKIASRVQVEGTGLKPVAVTLSGPASIAGFLLSLSLFNTIRYVITSPEVANGTAPALKLSHLYYRHFVEELMLLEPVIVNFSDVPKYEEANQLFSILKQGAVIANGVTVELGIWLGRNAGIGRLIILRPTRDKTILKYV